MRHSTLRFNQMGAAKNPHQGTAPRILCVCSAGLLRSPTIANFLAGKGYNTRAVGISEEYALIPMTPLLYYWADIIVTVVSPDRVEELARKWWKDCNGTSPVPAYIHLAIDDVYEFNSPLLITELDTLDLPTKIAEAMPNEK